MSPILSRSPKQETGNPIQLSYSSSESELLGGLMSRGLRRAGGDEAVGLAGLGEVTGDMVTSGPVCVPTGVEGEAGMAGSPRICSSSSSVMLPVRLPNSGASFRASGDVDFRPATGVSGSSSAVLVQKPGGKPAADFPFHPRIVSEPRTGSSWLQIMEEGKSGVCRSGSAVPAGSAGVVFSGRIGVANSSGAGSETSGSWVAAGSVGVAWGVGSSGAGAVVGGA